MKFAASLKIILVILLTSLFVSQTFAMSEEKQKGIAERIKPVGKVCVQGDSSCATAVVAAAGGAAKSGEEVYKASCTGCHSTGAAGAPKVGDKVAWAPRAAQGMDTLVKHAMGGFNAMPAKGLCMACSEGEIKATIEYMVKNSK